MNTTLTLRSALTAASFAAVIGISYAVSADINKHGPAVSAQPAASQVFLDPDGSPLTGIRAWNAARAMGAPNWRP